MLRVRVSSWKMFRECRKCLIGETFLVVLGDVMRIYGRASRDSPDAIHGRLFLVIILNRNGLLCYFPRYGIMNYSGGVIIITHLLIRLSSILPYRSRLDRHTLLLRGLPTSKFSIYSDVLWTYTTTYTQCGSV